MRFMNGQKTWVSTKSLHEISPSNLQNLGVHEISTKSPESLVPSKSVV